MKQEDKLIICKKALEDIVNYKKTVPTIVELGMRHISKDGNEINTFKHKKNYPCFNSDIKEHCLKTAKEALNKIKG